MRYNTRRKRRGSRGHRKSRRYKRRGGMLRVPMPTRADAMAAAQAAKPIGPAPPAPPPPPPPPQQSRGNFIFNFFGNLFNKLRRKPKVAAAAPPVMSPMAPPLPMQSPPSKYGNLKYEPYAPPAKNPISPTRTNQIAPLYETTHTQRLSQILQGICNNANECVVFGKETDKFDIVFEFTNFKYVTNIASVSSGANGFVIDFTYNRDGYRADAILKSSMDAEADSLYLEAYNGLKYINQYAKQFPLFLETYGVFEYTSQDAFEQIKSAANLGQGAGPYPNRFISNLGGILKNMQIAEYDRNLANTTCAENGKFAVLLQYIASAQQFYGWFREYYLTNGYEFQVELPNILFQIYSVLASLINAKAFTHYDLHPGNVMLYKVPDNTYVTITYKNAALGEDITIKTQYIVKIIDYGRSFLPDNEQIHNILCMAPRCNGTKMLQNDYGRYNEYRDKCGALSGYNYFGNGGRDDFYINRNVVNNAHDMVLIKRMMGMYGNSSISRWYRQSPATKHIKMILKSVAQHFVLDDGTPARNRRTSAREYMISPDEIQAEEFLYPRDITTVNELYWALCNLIRTDRFYQPSVNERTSAMQEYGKMTVDLNFNMKNIKPTAFTREFVAAAADTDVFADYSDTGADESISPPVRHDTTALLEGMVGEPLYDVELG